MRINTNVAALSANRYIAAAGRDTMRASERLASGLRITRAADDAAGLSLASTLRVSTRQLTAASSNAQQGMAVLSIAEGALQQIRSIYDRRAELVAQQSSTGTIGAQSATINTELTALDNEVTRIIGATQYQGSAIFGTTLSFNVGNVTGSDTVSVNLSAYSAAGMSSSNINDALVAVGIGQSRLDFSISNLRSTIVNQRAAESVIRDADMAEEMARFTSANVLQQAGTAMLAQANSSAQNVLQILRG